jgi:hypothetical protein
MVMDMIIKANPKKSWAGSLKTLYNSALAGKQNCKLVGKASKQ